MSESLAWEKWSTFSHNRYVEEAERYSRPGSVAQKKAFFEAHYKKIAAQKAAALLEQANAASNNETAEEEVANNISPHDSEIVIPNSNEVIDQQHVVATPYTAAYAFVNDNEYGSNAEKGQFENRMVDGADLVPEKHVFMVNSLEVEQSNQLRDVDNHKLAEMELGGTPEMEKPLLRVPYLIYVHEFWFWFLSHRAYIIFMATELKLESRFFGFNEQEETITFFLKFIDSW